MMFTIIYTLQNPLSSLNSSRINKYLIPLVMVPMDKGGNLPIQTLCPYCR